MHHFGDPRKKWEDVFIGSCERQWTEERRQSSFQSIIPEGGDAHDKLAVERMSTSCLPESL
jgi:hypothetical protein